MALTPYVLEEALEIRVRMTECSTVNSALTSSTYDLYQRPSANEDRSRWQSLTGRRAYFLAGNYYVPAGRLQRHARRLSVN
jgi:hypothetical protein